MDILWTALLAVPILALLVWVLSRSAMATRGATRRGTLVLLQGVISGETPQPRWDLFVGYPIAHDDELEQIRLRCLAVQEGDEETPPAAGGIGNYIFNREGRERIALIVADLQKLIDSEPYQRPF